MTKSLSLPGVGEPIDALRRYHSVILRAYETMYALTKDSNAEALTEALDAIEWCDNQMREYLYEEAAAAVGDYDPDFQGIVFNENLPEDLKLAPTERGFAIKNVPVWMLGNSARKKLHPLYHKDRPFIRKRQLWYWLVRRLLEDYRRPDIHWKTNPLPEPLPYARLLIVFRSVQDYDVSDLDHYSPLIEAVVNAIKSNRLIEGDRPGHFSYATEWEKSEIHSPQVDFYVEWADTPFPSWEVSRNEIPINTLQSTPIITPPERIPDMSLPKDVCPYCRISMKLTSEGTIWNCSSCGFQRKNRGGQSPL